MPRHKKYTNKFLHKGRTGDKWYITLFSSMLQSKAYISLSNTSKMIYSYMTLYAKGELYFDFPQRLYKDICSNGGFINAREELREKGFISWQYYEGINETTTRELQY